MRITETYTKCTNCGGTGKLRSTEFIQKKTKVEDGVDNFSIEEVTEVHYCHVCDGTGKIKLTIKDYTDTICPNCSKPMIQLNSEGFRCPECCCKIYLKELK